MVERWIVTGPEINRAQDEFTYEINVENDELVHHEEGYASQQQFQHYDTDLMDVLISKTNLFEEDSGDLVALDDHVCESVAAAIYVLNLEPSGQEQYNTFR